MYIKCTMQRTFETHFRCGIRGSIIHSKSNCDIAKLQNCTENRELETGNKCTVWWQELIYGHRVNADADNKITVCGSESVVYKNAVFSAENAKRMHNFQLSTFGTFIVSFRFVSFVPKFVRSLPSFVRSFVPKFVRSFVPKFVRSFQSSFVRSFVRCLRSFQSSFVRSKVRCLRSFVRSLPSLPSLPLLRPRRNRGLWRLCRRRNAWFGPPPSLRRRRRCLWHQSSSIISTAAPCSNRPSSRRSTGGGGIWSLLPLRLSVFLPFPFSRPGCAWK